MKKLSACAVFCLCTFPGLTFAAAALNPSPASIIPTTSFFFGLGGSYNSVKLDQYSNLLGVSNVYTGSTLVASGQASGPANPFHDTQSTLAPLAQLGYFKHFTNSSLLWGTKFLYQYLDTTANDQDVVAPQVGALTVYSGTDTFTGHAVIDSIQTSVNNEFLLIPYLGQSFKNSYVYAGLGPVLLSTKTRLYGVTGYANIDGEHTDVSGTPANFSSSKWMWGGAAQLGMNYYFDSTWFVDLNYTYAVTAQYKTKYSAPFANTTTSSSGTPYRDSGTLEGSLSQRITDQAIMISINKLFSF